jgi:DNA invertase Pin-like site-specific DNA recombinase
MDTTNPAGKLVFGIIAALAEFERELISERRRDYAGVKGGVKPGQCGGLKVGQRMGMKDFGGKGLWSVAEEALSPEACR